MLVSAQRAQAQGGLPCTLTINLPQVHLSHYAFCNVGARALFGEDEECITTMTAWQNMVAEARWVGRALYDAEEVVLGRGQTPAV